jgi:glycosyltransferase involved in cell wall biosynthesis
LNVAPFDGRALFVYSGGRAQYLLKELRNRIKSIDDLKISLTWKNPALWTNILCSVLENRAVGRRTLWVAVNRRPSVIRHLSSRVEKHIRTMRPKPDIVIQWSGLFAPYLEAPLTPYVLIEDNYSDPPGSMVQKDRLHGWTIPRYQQSFYEFQKELYKNAQCIFTLSRWCRDGLINQYGIDASRVIAVGWGPGMVVPEPGYFEKLPRTIVAVGNNFYAKGFYILLSCAELLPDFKVTIVGKDKFLKHVHIPGNVTVLGHASHDVLRELYSKSELLFLFSEFEASAHVLWEAQAHGCAVVGYDAYGIPEAVLDKETGLLLRTRDPVSIAQAIKELYRDSKVQLMGRAAVDHYLRNGTWENVASRIISHLPTPTSDY